ncbi:MAG: tetratricopeptide repeat protein [Deltaproteobacteria bacterium]|nr:tetratricopeptide repeat protein [Deltaproteobacteria bacterium]
MGEADPFRKAQRLVEAGRLPEAVALLRAALDEQPDDTRMRLVLAELLLKSGDLDGALVSFLRAARLYERAGQPLRALAVYRQMERLRDDEETRAAVARIAARLHVGGPPAPPAARAAQPGPVADLVDRLLAQAADEVRQGALELASSRVRTVLALAPHDERSRALMTAIRDRRP